jgi:hypothetical protein
MFIIARGQAKDMKDSIAEGSRAATAMEEVASATKRNTETLQPMLHKQMRAYISVDTGAPTCQHGTLNFAGAPIMTNTGLTPARNVSHKIKAAILDLSKDPGTYQFDESAEIRKSDAVLSPRQTFVLNTYIENRVPDEDVPGIMAGATKRLFVWGTVTYDDIYGGSWETNFCHNFVFYKDKAPDGSEVIRSLGYYYRSHNGAT